MKDVKAPLKLELIPNATYSWNQERAVPGQWGKSDSYQVNANRRYPVFYSEKRPFFMEGMGTFELTGSGGGNMRTAVYSLGKGSYVSGLVVDTEFGQGFNSVAAGDLTLHLGEHHRWSMTLMGTQTRDAEALSRRSGMAGQLTYGYGSDRYESNLQLEHYGTGFRMDTAFFTRIGYSGGNFYFGRNFYPDTKRHPWFKIITPFVFVDHLTGAGRLYAVNVVN